MEEKGGVINYSWIGEKNEGEIGQGLYQTGERLSKIG